MYQVIDGKGLSNVLDVYDDLRERLKFARILIQQGIGIILRAQGDTGMLLKAGNFSAATDIVQEAFNSFGALIDVLSVPDDSKK